MYGMVALLLRPHSKAFASRAAHIESQLLPKIQPVDRLILTRLTVVLSDLPPSTEVLNFVAKLVRASRID